jgi:hypothetical protein
MIIFPTSSNKDSRMSRVSSNWVRNRHGSATLIQDLNPKSLETPLRNAEDAELLFVVQTTVNE